PGQEKLVVRERAANQGSRRERGQNDGGGNTARRRQKMRGHLLMGTRATDGGGRKNHGKPASPPTELGANKTSYASAKIGVQRLMRRHPLPSTGFLGLVPPLQRYYEVLRLPAAHFAALRFLRLAIPSLRPLFVPPGPGRGAVDQSGVGRRYLQPPCSMETTGSPKFPEEPL